MKNANTRVKSVVTPLASCGICVFRQLKREPSEKPTTARGTPTHCDTREVEWQVESHYQAPRLVTDWVKHIGDELLTTHDSELSTCRESMTLMVALDTG